MTLSNHAFCDKDRRSSSEKKSNIVYVLSGLQTVSQDESCSIYL